MPRIKTIPLLETIFKNKGGSSDIWKTVSELLHNKEEEISVFCPYIKNKINSYDKETSLLALNLIDFCVDDGKMPLWSALNSKEFLSSLINNLKTREEQEIQDKILYLIQKWGKKFASYAPDLSNFKTVYISLKNNNITFPDNMDIEYNKYVKPNNRTSNIRKIDSNKITYNNNNNYNNQKKVETRPEDYLKDINVNLNTSSYEKKYKRLVNKLYDWTHAIQETNVLINENEGGKNNMNIDGLCKDLSHGNKQLVETINSGKLKDDTLMKISLCVTDDINMTYPVLANSELGQDSLQPVLNRCQGLCVIHKGAGNAGFGFNIADKDENGKLQAKSLKYWGGMCVVYASEYDLHIAINDAEQNDFANVSKLPGVTLPQTDGYAKIECKSWNEFVDSETRAPIDPSKISSILFYDYAKNNACSSFNILGIAPYQDSMGTPYYKCQEPAYLK